MATQESGKGPDEVIHELGGCGRFQIRMALLIHVMNIVVAWSLYAMVFVTATPKWWCNDSGFSANLSLNNVSEPTDKIYEKSCVDQNGTSCSRFEFETSEMKTIVTEVIIFEPRREKTGLRGFPTRCDTYRPVQSQKQTRGLKVWL